MERACEDCHTEAETPDERHRIYATSYRCDWCTDLCRVGKENLPVVRRSTAVKAIDEVLDFGDSIPIAIWAAFIGVGGLVAAITLTVVLGWWAVWLVWIGTLVGIPAIISATRAEVLYRASVIEQRNQLTERWDGWSGRVLR